LELSKAGLLSGQVGKQLAEKWLEDNKHSLRNELARLFGEMPADEQNALARVGAKMRAEEKLKGSRDGGEKEET
jgi:hypothetical protein